MTEDIELYVTNTDTVYEGDYDNPNICIKLHGRTRENEQETITVEGFDPHFYVLAEERDNLAPNEHDDLVRYEETDITPLKDRFVHRTPGQEERELVKVIAASPARKTIRGLREHFSKSWGADIGFENMLRIERDIKTGVRAPSTRCTAEDIEPVEITDVNPRILYFDIETDDRGEGFPEPGDARILSIAAYDSYEQEYTTFLDTEGQTMAQFFKLDYQPDSLADLRITEPGELLPYTDERQMLLKFSQWVEARDPDIITGWNSGDDANDGFDLPQLLGRMDTKGVSTHRLTRRGDAEYYDTGDGDWRVRLDGRSAYDLMDAWAGTKFSKPDSKKLERVAMDALDDAKIEHPDMGYYEMYAEDPATFINYNTKDTRLTVEIDIAENVFGFKKRLKDMIGVDWEESRENNDFVSMSIRRKCREHGVVMITAWDNEHVIEAQQDDSDEVNYEGAYVFDAFTGLKQNVVGKDLASLYPMTQYMLNASPDTKIDRLTAVKHDIPHVVAENGTCFRTDVDSVIKELVDEYAELKMEYKRKKKALTYGTEEYEVVSEAYGTTKTIYNSYYGFTGWDKSPLYDPAIAAAVTLTGQVVIKTSAKYINEETAAQVVYGDTDSVPAEEPVLVKHESGDIEYVEIQQLHGVEDQYQVWTEDGFTNINAVWKKPNRKQNYTIRTKNGLVHTTEDHSLVRDDGSMVKPGELSDEDRLLHRDVSEAIEDGSKTISTDRAWLYGFFAADGSAGIYDTEANGYEVKKHGFALNKNDTDLLERAQSVLRSEFGVNSAIRDYRESSGVHKLQLTDNADMEWGGVNEVIDHFVDVSYTESREKCVPKAALNGTDEIVEAFLDGYMGGDGYVGERYTKWFHEASTKDLHLASGLTMCLQRLGYTFNIDYRRNHDSEYYRLRCQQYHRGNPEELCSVEEYDYDGEYVYDIETENHHFQAGAGNLIVHNSNYAEYPADWSQERVLEEAQSICDTLNEEVYPNLCEQFNIDAEENEWFIELEMLADRFFMTGRKKFYAYRSMWSEGMAHDEKVNDGDGKVNISGYPCVKSNFATITRETQRDILKGILNGWSKSDVSNRLFEAASRIDPTNPDWDYIGMPQGLGKKMNPEKEALEDYYDWASSGNHPESAHPRGAWFANELLDTNLGKDDQPKRCYLKPTLAVGEDEVDVISYESHRDLEPIAEDLKMDAGAMQKKTLENPMESICEAFDVEMSAALRGKTQTQTALGAF